MQKRMGTRFRGGSPEPGSERRGRLALPFLVAVVALLAVAPQARATFHLVSIREVHPGSAAAPQSSYVELQMYSGGQNFVKGHAVKLYNAAGGAIGSFAFGANLPGEGASQQTMLVGDSGVQAAFGVTPDLVDSGFNVPAAGGAACWAETVDCVSGTPVDGSAIPDGMAIRRKISAGTCTNLLDGADDSNDSATDFADATPGPVSYATVPSPMSCTPVSPPPTAVIDTKPAKATMETAAAFSFHSNPAGAGFECRLDSEAFADCDSGSVTYAGPLSEKSHTFQVRASNANGTGSAASYTWTVDLTPPSASITSHPADPSPGPGASFKYSSNESGSKFECRLAPLEATFSACDTQPKTYSGLDNGEYEFEVRAIDPAGNVQPSPTVFPWTVDSTIPDTTPPDTSIVTRPPDPSPSSTAMFTYTSTEPGSTFECKLDGAAFASCAAAGVVYSGLGSGSHTFQVRAIDSSENADPTPAGYTFDVVLPSPALPAPPSPFGPSPLSKPQPPETVLSLKPPAKTRDRTPSFRFRSSSAGASFECKLDGGAFRACRSPFTTKSLSLGGHMLKVRAVAGGAPDPTPATCAFKVVKRR
jgi:hypothetical protein